MVNITAFLSKPVHNGFEEDHQFRSHTYRLCENELVDVTPYFGRTSQDFPYWRKSMSANSIETESTTVFSFHKSVADHDVSDAILSKIFPILAPLTELTELADERLQVAESFGLQRYVESAQYIVEAVEINEFGYGDTWAEAVVDLQEAIGELYFLLHAEQDNLGAELTNIWVILSRKVKQT